MHFVGLAILFAFFSCSVNPSMEGTEPNGHEAWNSLLQKHVSENGEVDYQGFKKDREKLSAYLEELTGNAPNEENWSEAEQLAYWINLYNAFTIDLVLQHYPVESIKDIGSKIKIPFVNTPWDIKFIEIDGKEYDLNNIEHGLIRKKYNEPRIHFALVCAAVSCPKLRNEAYTADKLDRQLEEQATEFINNPAYNKLGQDQLKVSKLFTWYKGDFTEGSIIGYLNKYADEKINADAEVSYMEYDWALNDVGSKKGR